MIKYDVLIAGAGPAGCATAIVLAQAGLSVCLVDENGLKTHKIGESLPAATLRLLNRLGISALSDCLSDTEYQATSGHLSAWGTDEWTLQSGIYNPEGGGWHMNRVAFERGLQQQALKMGVIKLTGAVGNVSKTVLDDAFCVTWNGGEMIQSRYIVDATGRDFAIGRQLGIKRHLFDTQLALFTWLNAPENTKDTLTRIQSVETGWWYSSCLPSGERVLSMHGLPETIAALKKTPHEFWAACETTAFLPFEIPIVCRRALQVKSIGLGRAEKVYEKGCFLVGDAAISFDALSSQGIFFALYSGIRAAENIIKNFHNIASLSVNSERYTQTVQNVFNANRQARIQYYHAEYRFENSNYWKTMQYLTRQVAIWNR